MENVTGMENVTRMTLSETVAASLISGRLNCQLVLLSPSTTLCPGCVPSPEEAVTQ